MPERDFRAAAPGPPASGRVPGAGAPRPPRVRITRIEHGTYQDAPRLNPRFEPGHPLLLAALEIRWDPPDPSGAIALLERSLLRFSPDFARHECRGEGIYHVFPGRDSGAAGRRNTLTRRSARHGSVPFEGALALAHLLEHAVIDFQSGVTGAIRCSGVTAAHRRDPRRFDLLVECRDPEVGRCCLLLAVRWIVCIFRGRSPGTPERDVLEALRVAADLDGAIFSATQVAGRLDWRGNRAQRALTALRETGYLETAPGGGNRGAFVHSRIARSAGAAPPPEKR